MLNNGVPLKFVCEVTRPANLCMISISLNSTYPELSFFSADSDVGQSSFIATRRRVSEKAM